MIPPIPKTVSFRFPRFARLRGRRPLLGQAALAAGGLCVIGLTLRLYSILESARPVAARPHGSSAEADRQIESAKSTLKTHPEDIPAHVSLAMAYYQKGPEHYVDAMNALEKARALGATSEHLFFYAGVMYDALGLPDYAINELSKYLRHHPNDYETMLRLAHLHFRQKRLDEAQRFYQEALEMWPKDATAWFNLAIIHKEKKNYPAALHGLEQVIRIAGRLPPGGLYEQGEIYRLRGDENRALQLYQQELAAQPGYIPALEATEAIIRGKGDWKQARNIRKRIVVLKQQQAPKAKPNS